MKYLLPLLLLLFACASPSPQRKAPQQIRIASYNLGLKGHTHEAVLVALRDPHNAQLRQLTQVIQQVRPDVLALMECSYDEKGEALELFRRQWLHQGEKALEYPYVYLPTTNTGLDSGMDLDGDGKIGEPEDCYGFGRYPGQYAMAFLSRFPIDHAAIRSYQRFLWKDMPDALQPRKADGSPYYPVEVFERMRLSSKNHVIIPIAVPGKRIYLLAAHPTPPVFDGPEDRNGCRNHDEIRLLADLLADADYLRDDQGQTGGLAAEAAFVIMGDLNADPVDGDSREKAIMQLLAHPRVHPAVAQGTLIPASRGGLSQAAKRSPKHQGDPAYHTAGWGLRVDYVLPSADLKPLASGVFWPDSTETGHQWATQASDHRLVWVDLTWQ